MRQNTSRLLTIVFALLMLGGCTGLARTPRTGGASPYSPRLEKHGNVTQLIVDGRPFLVLGGELHNSSSSSLEYMRPLWPKLKQMNLNTVLAAVSWEQIELTEGQYDFSVVDGLIREARRNDLHLILLWFGSWKNGTSRYAADWVKENPDRYPRVLNKDGRTLEILSTFSENTLNADAHAFAALMRHLREIDEREHTVLMVQMQNEVGILGDTRDRSPAANEAFAKPVPGELFEYFQKFKDTLLPETRKAWEDGGSKTSGTWTEVFGAGPRTDEIFMAWQYGRFMNEVSEAGKAEYALPTFVNAWIVQPEDKAPGDYPSGGPQVQNLDIYRAAAPSIDFVAPDIYLPDFPGIVSSYGRAGNPMFIPEARAGAIGAANAYYAIGQFGSIGYSPFGIDSLVDEANPISRAYAKLAQLAPLILEHQAKGSIAGVWLNERNPSQKVQLGKYTLNVELRRTRGTTQPAPLGYAILINLGPEEYLVSGSDIQVTFSANDEQSPPIVGLTKVEEGSFQNGNWVAGRRLNGDDVQLRYDLSQASAEKQSGAGLRFGPGAPGIQKVKLHRYR